ncbi:VWA domain-containing protein [Plantactinospora sp. GCM10030261]|uniref:vWA domain-containing protein n=1 Tax=Plantactinospora sp. GCM10030261 TaxID=3273420 RepID=UPI00361E1160
MSADDESGRAGGPSSVTDPAGALAGLLDFVAALRAAGLSVPPDRVHTLLTAVDELGVARLYWAGRLTLCGCPADLAAYDAVFLTHFGGEPIDVPESRPAVPAGTVRVTVPFGLVAPEPEPTGGDALGEVAASASGGELLRHRDLGDLTGAEREEVAALLALLAPVGPVRRGRRWRPARRGAADPRRTLTAALRRGGEVTPPARRDRAVRPRRLVLLLDVSGSMARYADALLRFAHAAVRCRPHHTEVFSIGTRLTRLTGPLRLRDPAAALRAAGAAIPDWRGGTRLGDGLGVFLARYGHRGTARGAVVVVFSDGWERGSPDRLGWTTARLSRLAYRLVWVTPHRDRPGFAPTAGGLAAVVPHLDALVAGHSVAALTELVRVLGEGNPTCAR